MYGGAAVGKRKFVLPLCVYGPEGRLIFYFKNPNELSEKHKFNLVEILKARLVLVTRGEDRNCLNFMRTYRSTYINTVFMVPFLGSLLIGIIWTVIAIRKYSQDVQVSAQTAFTIASYVVTAGE